jgi:hypothetical protein
MVVGELAPLEPVMGLVGRDEDTEAEVVGVGQAVEELTSRVSERLLVEAVEPYDPVQADGKVGGVPAAHVPVVTAGEHDDVGGRCQVLLVVLVDQVL